MGIDATAQRKIHGWATVGWAVITVPACVLIVVFRDHPAAAIWTLVWITLVSHYANVVGHWSAYQAVRVEVKQDEQITIQSDIANVQVNNDEGSKE